MENNTKSAERETMNKKEFEAWWRDWFKRIPKCKDFVCIHELDSCGIYRFCGCCTIYETFMHNQDIASECDDVSCIDCARRHQCKMEQGNFVWNGEYESYDHMGWDGEF